MPGPVLSGGASFVYGLGVRLMTCRFELEFKGKPYPRSCPTCGISGKCHKDYRQIKKEGGGYELVNASNQNASGQFIGMDGKPYRPAEFHEGRIGYTDDRPKVSQATLDGVAEAEGLIGHSAKHDTLAEAPKPHPFMAPAVAFKPANVGIKITRVQRAMMLDSIEKALHDAKADLNNHSVEKETEVLCQVILDILNAS